jgi:hypothetical protein
MDASQCGNDRPRFGLPAVTQKLLDMSYKTLSGFRYRDLLVITVFIVQFISEFEYREWSFVLIPDRFTRLIGHSCCFKFKLWINALSSVALKFMPLVAFSRPLCHLPFYKWHIL